MPPANGLKKLKIERSNYCSIYNLADKCGFINASSTI